MRKSILLLVVMGCGGDVATGEYTVLAEMPEAAAAVACERVRIPGDPSPGEIRLTSDTTWTLLDRRQGLLLELDDDLQIRHRLEIPDEGPGSATHPVSVAALGDTAWAIAARGGLRMVVLGRDGTPIRSVPLDFIPHSIEAAGEDLLLTAMPLGEKPPTLVVRVRDGLQEPLPVPRRAFTDMTVNALGNAALVETLADGSALVIHQFMAPRGFRVDPTGAVSAVPVPTPGGTRDAIGYIPTAPVTEEQLHQVLLPVMALTVSHGHGHIYLLTRSGRNHDGRPERLVLRLDRDLGFLSGYTLDVPAAGMVVLPRVRSAVVYDDMDRFYRCPLGTRES